MIKNIGPDGKKNSVVSFSGILEDPEEVLSFNFSEMSDSPKACKIEAVAYSLEDKLRFRLWWVGERQKALILPLEGRGVLNLEGIQSLHSPRWATGISITISSATYDAAFLLVLDLEKQ